MVLGLTATDLRVSVAAVLLKEGLVHNARCVVLHMWQHMSVDAERDRDRGVTQHFTDHFRIDAFAEE